MSALLIDAVVRDGRVHITDQDFYRTRMTRAAKAWGEGAVLKVRIEPVDEAAQYHQFKHLYGHVFEPVSEYTGFTKEELCLMAKARFMPDDGRTSLTQLNHDELRAFSEATERWLRDECAEAFAIEEPRIEAA